MALTAAEITSGLLIAIPREFQARVWRVNVTGMKIGDRFIRSGIVGMADISGIVGPHGQRIELEIKAGRDRLSEAQISWGRMIEAHGGIFLVARDVEKTLADLRMRLEMRQK